MPRITIASLSARVLELEAAYNELDAENTALSVKYYALLEAQKPANPEVHVTYYRDHLGQAWCKHRTGNDARSFKVDSIPA